MSRSIHIRAYQAALVLLLSVLMGCVTPRPSVDSVSDAIVVTAADVETVAQQVQRACGNLEPNGPCRLGAPISTDTKERLKGQLQEAVDSLVLANQALAADEELDADARLQRAQSILLLVRAVLAESED